MAISYGTEAQREFPDLDAQTADKAAEFANYHVEYDGMKEDEAKEIAKEEAQKYKHIARRII